MKWIKKDLKEIIENYINGKNYAKPLMLVVTSDSDNGIPNLYVDDVRHWIMETYDTRHIDTNSMAELLDAIPEEAGKAEILLYYPSWNQLNSEYLKYAVNVCRKLQKPTIWLINDYDFNKYSEEESNISDFEVVLCNGDTTPTDWEDWFKWAKEDPNKENV